MLKKARNPEERPGAPAFLPDASLTFPDVFAGRAHRGPDTVAFAEVAFEARSPRAIPHSFGDTLTRVRAAAVLLERAGLRRGDRVVLCVDKTPVFFAFFLAAEALGAIPVPLPSAGEARSFASFRQRTRAVIDDCTPRVMVVDSESAAEHSATEFDGLAIITTTVDGLLTEVSGSSPLSFDRSPGEIAFLQYTSGSTGSPKGVVVTHANLVANLRASSEAAQFGPNDRSLSWLPLYHDMGLIGGLLLGQYLGIPTYVMPTRSFVGRPDAWLRAMTAFGATFACAPNFAYDILARRMPDSALVGLDLSQWRLAFDGAEPVDAKTLEAFAARFAPVGLRANSMFPVYGMAECTLAISFGSPGAPVRHDFVDRHLLATTGTAVQVAREDPSAVAFTSVGRPVPGLSVRIVAAGGSSELAERQTGEIVVRGASVTPGYFGGETRVDATDRELRTGDLGYLADGDLFIVDRIKDLIIVAGRNLVPSDVERAISSMPGVHRGAIVAFSITRDGTEELCIVVGAEPAATRDPGFATLVRGRVLELFDVAPHDVAIVKPGLIPKTSSGKLQRLACRRLYESGAFRQP